MFIIIVPIIYLIRLSSKFHFIACPVKMRFAFDSWHELNFDSTGQ